MPPSPSPTLSPEPPSLVRVACDYHASVRREDEAATLLGRLRSERRAAAEEYGRRLRAEHPPGQLHVVDFEGISYGCRPQPPGQGVHRDRIGAASPSPGGAR